MSGLTKTKPSNKNPKNNPVAKHMEEFNRPSTHRDKKKDYRRKPKHEDKYYE